MSVMCPICPINIEGAMAEWLRRQIRNLFRFPGAGSNPAGVVFFLLFLICFFFRDYLTDLAKFATDR